MSSIEEIKARIDIVELVSEGVKLRRSGKNYMGFCPFHSNTRTPAFVVFPDSGSWRCFGQCNEGGDIFGYVMKKDGLDFSEALRYLAERAGVDLKTLTPQEQAVTEEHDRLRGLLEEAVIFYRNCLLSTTPGKEALEYLHGRGLKDDTLEAFEIGYAPDAWEAAIEYFTGKGYTLEELIEAGLVTKREPEREGQSERTYDRFRGRILFPIRDERGRMAGFGARILDPDDFPKFLNSPQSPVFDKGRLLYGLHKARKSIRSQDQAIIVEGYLDVISLHQGGSENAVSPMGTALTEHQLTLLKRFSRRIILALDADAAGDKATLRGLQVARQALDRETEAVFDARGLLKHEARLQADIRVTTLPPGLDPDDVILRDPEEWNKILADARPVVLHVMETLAAGQDLEDAKVKAEIAGQVLPLIEDLPGPIERDTYRQRLARLLKLDERTLMTQAAPIRRRFKRTPRQPAVSPEPFKASTSLTDEQRARLSREAHCLGVLLRMPDLLYRVDRLLQEFGLDRLRARDFQKAEYSTIYRLIQDSLDQDETEPLEFVLNRLTLALMESADDLLARTGKLDSNDNLVLEDLMRAVLYLRRRDLHDTMEFFRLQMEEAQQQGLPPEKELYQNVQQYSLALQRVNKAIGKYTSRTIVTKGQVN
jgi:DNA primase